MSGTKEEVFWMRRALDLARVAERAGEIPVGAVVVRDGELLAEGCNGPIAASDATAHAEIVAIQTAGRATGNYRLSGTTLYVTLEPCMMCAGALIHARVQRLVFGAADPRAGAVGSVIDIRQYKQLNHSFSVTKGVLQQECAGILQDFFQSRRELKRARAGQP